MGGLGGLGRGEGVAAAFGALYAACGLPPPAVRMERNERAYRKSASVLSVERRTRINLMIVLAVFLLLVAFLAFLLFGAIVNAWAKAETVGSDQLAGAACAAAAFALLLLAAWAAYGKAEMMNGWSVFLARQIGLHEINSTPRVLASVLHSALWSHAGIRPDRLGDETPDVLQFIDACFRLGRRRVLASCPDPRMTALVGAPGFGADAPRVLRLAAAASALVEEALLMDGFVLALVPGCARPAPVRLLVEPVRRIGAPPSLDWLDGDGNIAWASDPSLAPAVQAALREGAESTERELRAIGVDKCADALSVLPFGEDPSGRLYRFRHDLLMVRVEDEVSDPDGSPLVHWVTVPPHVVTAREAVAWSFGLPEGDYAPTAQS